MLSKLKIIPLQKNSVKSRLGENTSYVSDLIKDLYSRYIKHLQNAIIIGKNPITNGNKI